MFNLHDGKVIFTLPQDSQINLRTIILPTFFVIVSVCLPITTIKTKQ